MLCRCPKTWFDVFGTVSENLVRLSGGGSFCFGLPWNRGSVDVIIKRCVSISCVCRLQIILCTRLSSKFYKLLHYWTFSYFDFFSNVGSSMIVTTGAGTCGHNNCMWLHWHLSFHKFDIKYFKKFKEKKSFDMYTIFRVCRIIAWPICKQCLNSFFKMLMSTYLQIWQLSVM